MAMTLRHWLLGVFVRLLGAASVLEVEGEDSGLAILGSPTGSWV